MEYKVAVIIPAYNSEGCLERAVASVRAQTLGFESVQLLLADDRSTDGTYEICRRLAEGAPNVSAVRTDANSGSPGTPRNMALPLVRAPYVMFLDDDDALEPRACEILYGTAERTGAHTVSGSCRAVSDEVIPGFDPNSELFRNEGLAEGEYDLRALTERDCLAFCIGVCTKIYRMSVINAHDLRFADGDVGEDNPFLYLYTLLGDKGYVVNTDVFVRTARSSSLSRGRGVSFYAGIARAANKGLARAAELGLESGYERLLGLAGLLEHMLDCLLKDPSSHTEQELAEIFAAWRDVFSRAYGGRTALHSPYARILARCAAAGDMKSALYDFAALKDFYSQRERELGDIFSSRTWRLASAARRLLGRD